MHWLLIHTVCLQRLREQYLQPAFANNSTKCSGSCTCLNNLPTEMFQMNQYSQYQVLVPNLQCDWASQATVVTLKDSSKIAVGCNPTFILLSVVEIYIDDPVWPSCKYQMYFYKLATAFFDIASWDVLYIVSDKHNYNSLCSMLYRPFFYVWLVLSLVSKLSASAEICCLQPFPFFFLVFNCWFYMPVASPRQAISK